MVSRYPRIIQSLVLFCFAEGLAAGQSLTITDVTPLPPVANQAVTISVLGTDVAGNTLITFNDAGDSSITCPPPASASAAALCAQLGTARLNGGVAVLTLPGGLSAGRHQINACAPTFCSPNLGLIVIVATKVVLTISPPSPALVCTPLALTATVTPANASGTVNFYDSGAALIGAGQLSGSGTVTIQVAPSIGIHSLFATYTPMVAAPFAAATSDPVPVTINGDTQVMLASDRATARPGDPVTLTATVISNPQCTAAPPLPAGTVTLLDGGNAIQQASVPGDGRVPPFRTSSLSVGTHALMARYNGDATGRYGPKTSNAVTVVIFSGSATATLIPAGTPQSTPIGTAFAAPLQVTYRDATGNPQAGVTVSFTAPSTGASALVAASAMTNASGVASVTATANGISGSYMVTASTADGASAVFSLTNLAGGNLAQGKAAQQTSQYPGSPSAQAAVDGSTDGNYAGGSVTATNFEGSPWWQVDLQNSAAIGSVVVWNRTDCCTSRLNDYWVFVSDTPFQPTDTPFNLVSRPGTFSSHQTSEPTPSTVVLLAAQGRYVRVQLNRPDILSLAEVQVFGPSGAVVNAAPGKLATQSSNYPASPDASAAIDGNTDGNYFHGSVTATNVEAGAWWQVDLRSSLAITSVVVWNRTDCCANRLSDFWVFVSDTPFNAGDTPASLQFRPGTFSSHQMSPPSPSVSIPVNGQGRYIRVQLGTADYLSLAEVQVFTPANGGPNDLAQGKPAAQSSTFPGNTGASAATDGNTDGNYYHNSVTATNQEFFPWWQVDLQASSNINSVTVWNRTDCCGARLNDFWVFVSDTPFSASDTPGTLPTRPGTFSSHQATAPGPSVTIPVNARGRYVRAQLNGFDILSLAEVQVF